jgi:hypothetical protein
MSSFPNDSYLRLIRYPSFTSPIEGFKYPVNLETGVQYPNCCDYHKSLKVKFQTWYSKFPNCCKQHRELSRKSWFNKSKYDILVEHILRCVIYTEYHIDRCIEKDNWFQDIVYYIEYTKFNFGTPAVGVHLYFETLVDKLKNVDEKIPIEKKKRIIDFIDSFKGDSNEHSEKHKSDFNILNQTYQKWLKIFPFELSFFNHLKKNFENTLPFLKDKLEYNPYLKMAIAQFHTKSDLINVLLNLTNNLLTQINTATLYEKGLLTDPQRIKLNLVLNERKMKLEEGYLNSSKDEEQRYRKILKEWFADEKRFIDEVTPLVKALPPQPIVKQNPELKIAQIALKYVYEGLQITRENGNDIAKEYGHNSGEKLFQLFTYYSSSANRKGKPTLCTPKKLDNKIKLIESIIELLPTEKQERAKDEVLILKKIYEAEYQ